MSKRTSDSIQNIRLQRGIAIAGAVLLVVKFVAWSLTHSVAVLTDALESIVNVVAGFVGLYSLHVSAQPRDANHPYGHGKAEFLSAAIEGTLVLSAGAIILYTAVKNFFYPQPLQAVDTGIYLVGATAVVNWLLGSIALRQGRKTGSLALMASGRHLQTDTWSTIGIILGLVLISFTGWQWIDAAVAFGFGAYIAITGYRIVRKSVAGIMDEADMELLTKMTTVLNAARRDAWVDLHNLRVIKYGNVLHLDCHLTVPWYFNVHQAHEEVDQLAAVVRKEFGETLELFVHSDGCLYFQCPLCEKRACPVRQHPFKEKLVWTVDNILQNEKHGWRRASGDDTGNAAAQP
ncbi:cation diffusion facilitator family transporter [Pseudocnuella soli]|uniref:cation diffusion facilitator family transporter n=1 Tax=Pseudocnuella soli TaxID=2502779 RepID=UPI0010524BED|nr:cation diffusion facilitator family transporter [Pseudocnuella soli]